LRNKSVCFIYHAYIFIYKKVYQVQKSKCLDNEVFLDDQTQILFNHNLETLFKQQALFRLRGCQHLIGLMYRIMTYIMLY